MTFIVLLLRLTFGIKLLIGTSKTMHINMTNTKLTSLLLRLV